MIHLSITDFQAACKRVAPYIHRTPLREFHAISKDLKVPFRVFLKLENEQKTQTFKVRGAYNALLQLNAEEKERGVITRSSGNFAQAVALAARTLGMQATIVMPDNAPKIKIKLTQQYEPEIIFSGPVHEEGDRVVKKLAEEKRLCTVHPYDQKEVIEGQGTLAIEVYDDLPSLKHFFCAVGGGGLMSGCACALKQLNPEIETIGVEPSGADDYCRSRKLGRPVALEKVNTIADGLSASQVGVLNRPLLDQYVDKMESVSDERILEAMRYAKERLGFIAEPSGAAALAALLYNKHQFSGDVVCVISGANVDLSTA